MNKIHQRGIQDRKLSVSILLQIYICRSPSSSVSFTYQSRDLVVIKSCFRNLLWGWLTTPQSPQGPSRGLHGSLLSFPIQSTSHNAHRAFFSIQSHSVISLSLHLVDHFQQRLWTSSKGKYLHDCCPCLGPQLISWILTSEPFKMPGTYPTLSGTGWDGKNIGFDRKLWLKTTLK